MAHELTIQTNSGEELIDITQEIAAIVDGWDCAAVLVSSPHTTAGVLINAHADPDVARDIVLALSHMVPANITYTHDTGNSPAHVKATLVGTSQIVPLRAGRLELGYWQSIFLAEFDGPRVRHIHITPLASPG